MKKLYLIRHAKSSWADPTLRDFDRPLNKRGRRDAPFMGKKLAERKIKPDFIISSSAKRAEQTVQILAKAIAYPQKRIYFSEAIYLADENGLYRILRSCDDRVNSLLLVGHNFGITDFAVSISGTQIENIPTCGIVAMKFDLDSWQQVEPNTGRLLFFDWPKKYKKER
ncbi:MAG: histidine phosphatase family protein [Proteobacteria bacterium]|nr:histidine phosphatase family protein [Pseudomonadota bacterium]MBU1060063.1 histidine phosphatase family protein [Pseudomonadota bacterium]